MIILLILLSFNFITATNLVDHKNLQLNLYLDLIKYNTQEKLGILPYILQNPKGVFLEVGTGGDPIADLLSKIPDNISPTIIASDIDSNILKLLPTRHTVLNQYLNNINGPKLELLQLDATKMDCFEDQSLDGINASAVVHEIISYAGGTDALDNFFKDALRIIKNNGVLIYRDPEGVLNKEEIVNVNLKNSSIRLFTHIFLVKFLDKQCSMLALKKRKNQFYKEIDLIFKFYKKNEIKPCTLNYQEYLKVRSYEIDFSRSYQINLPRGLCREIERHYLTYLHQCNPLMFVKCIPTINSNTYFVNYLAHSTTNILDDFLQKNNLNIQNGMIDVETKRILNQKITRQLQAIEYGILLHLDQKNTFRKLSALLKQYNLDPNIYIIQTKGNEFLLDYRIFGLLYDQILEEIFDENNGPINPEDMIHAQWLKREGEETYIYYSDDQLITKIAEIALTQNRNLDTCQVLCPISSNHNQFIPRLCYEELLKNTIDITDYFGYTIKIKEGKRIIHLKKILLKDALPIYKEIINKKPHKYSHLKKFIINEKLI